MFRAIWNLVHNRTKLINWYAQAGYASLAILATYLAYKYLILPKTPLFPDLETVANELWIIIFLFLYKIFNEIKFEPKFKKKRVDSYLENRLSLFKNKYEDIIDLSIDKELQSFKNKASTYLIDQKNLENFKFLRHTLLKPFDHIFSKHPLNPTFSHSLIPR